MLPRIVVLTAVSLALIGCGRPPPASKIPTARAAFDRVHGSQDCGMGIHATAKIDHFGKGRRIRTDLLAFAAWPDRLRMDVVSPFGVTLATLTSDGEHFAFNNLRDRRFFFGQASACNIARLMTVPLPGHVLASLLRGEAPILKHAAADEEITWEGDHYLITVKGTNGTVQRVKVQPHPGDVALPWDKQRVRVLDVEVAQQGIVLYHAQLADHEPAPMDKPDSPTPTSGPTCTAELARRIRVEVPGKDKDVLFRYENVTWNPPLREGTFTQPVPGGVSVEWATCADSAPPN